MPTTVTGKIGPGATITSQVFSNVTDIEFDQRAQILRLTTDGKIVEVDLYGITTVTYTIAAHVATVTVS